MPLVAGLKGGGILNTKFPVLSTISILLRIVGWIIILGAIVFTFYKIVPTSSGQRFTSSDWMQLVTGLSIAMVGLVGVAFGEIVGVFFAIEENTRKGQGASNLGEWTCPNCKASNSNSDISCKICGYQLH